MHAATQGPANFIADAQYLVGLVEIAVDGLETREHLAIKAAAGIAIEKLTKAMKLLDQEQAEAVSDNRYAA